MKLSRKTLFLALSASVFFTACGDGSSQNTLYFNNYSLADSEGYTFLKTVSTEANYQQMASSALANAALAGEIKSTYTEIAKEMHTLSNSNDVLTPQFAAIGTDSVDIAQLIKSQEVIIGQLKMVTENTNVSIADYARKTLPTLESLLTKTKAEK